ncbi:Phospho-2-dehydro-3-deoxyheptonate aldolase 2 [Forsythia ovata]|uniref:Phospho-2-dehydro-3-deoxyheptonate aldolase n=1 Tax=Forsythia ovata TaxID=205694 RepID=A0ABD1VIL7_9LAMI
MVIMFPRIEAYEGGNCAESFKEFNADKVRDTFRVLLQMSVVLKFGGQMPVIKPVAQKNVEPSSVPWNPLRHYAARSISQLSSISQQRRRRLVGRMGGQFAKPRSSPFEEKDGVKLTNYRGDAVNGYAFDEKLRIPDPHRMIRAYTQSHNLWLH